MNTLFNQFTHFKYMQVTPHNTGNMRLSCRVRYYASFATWLVLAYIIPMRCFGFWNALWPCFVFQAAGSLCATYNIIINHVFEMAHTSTESYGQSWAKMSVAGSCNHGAGDPLALASLGFELDRPDLLTNGSAGFAQGRCCRRTCRGA